MSIHNDTAGDDVHRNTGAFISNASDYTIMGWFRSDVVPAPYTAVFEITDSISGNYEGIYFDADSRLSWYATNDNDATWLEIKAQCQPGFDYHFAVVYNATTKLHSFFINGVFIGADIKDMSGETWDSQLALWSNVTGDAVLTYLRIWQRGLNQNEIITNMNSNTISGPTSIFENIPFLTTALDISGNSRNWTKDASLDYVTSLCRTQARFGMGGWIRTSPALMPNLASAGVNGLPIFKAMGYPGSFICSLNMPIYTKTTGDPPELPLITSPWFVNLIYLNGSGPTQVVVPMSPSPYVDPMVGHNIGIGYQTNYRINWPFIKWEMKCMTASFDIVTGTYQGDGRIELRINDVVLYSADTLSINRRLTSDVMQFQFYPCGDMDGVWITNQYAYPTYAGAQHVPSSPFLVDYFNYNDGVKPPVGWNETNILGFAATPIDGISNSGLEDTYGMSLNDDDPEASASLLGGHSYSAMISSAFPMQQLFSTEATTGTLVIVKETEPDGDPEVFSFVATGTGLSNFTLMDGNSKIFGGLAAGSGRSVVETVPDGWNDPVYTVSNGSPHTNITIAAGETVTVNVFNSKRTDGSGLYVLTGGLGALIPGRRNDQLVNDAGVFVDTAIPNPFIETALLPEEE